MDLSLQTQNSTHRSATILHRCSLENTTGSVTHLLCCVGVRPKIIKCTALQQGVDSRAVALACFFDNLMLMIVTYPWNAMLLMEIGKQHVSVD